MNEILENIYQSAKANEGFISLDKVNTIVSYGTIDPMTEGEMKFDEYITKDGRLKRISEGYILI